jgi:O-antigen/teichoic acid export membrane protein
LRRALFAHRLVRNDLVKHGTLVFASTMLGSVFLYAFYFVASRWLGVEQYGTLSALVSGILVLSVFGVIGATIVVRFSAEFEALGESGKLRRLSDVLALWSIAIVLLGAVLGFALVHPIGAFLHLDDPSVVSLAAIVTAFGIVLPVLRGVAQGAQRFRVFAVSMLVETIGKSVLAVVGILAGFGVLGAIGGYAVASLVAVAYTYGSLRLTFRTQPDRMRIDFRRLVTTSGGIACAIFAVTTLTFFDVVLAKHYLSAQQAGLYGAAILAGRAIYVVISFLPAVLLPKATARATSGEPVTRLLLQAVGAALALSGTILAFYAFSPALVVRLFAGSAFVAAAPLVLPLGAAAAILGTANIVISYKIGLHRFDFVIPLLTIMAGEIVTIARFHASPFEIIRTLLVGHTLVLVATLYRVTSPAPAARPQLRRA